MVVRHDRRRFQRLKLAKPILANLDGGNSLILDVGVGGAFVEHYGEVSLGQRLTLSFRFRGQDIVFHSEVVRTVLMKPVRGAAPALSHSGFRFVEPVDDAEDRLQDMMVELVGRLLAAHRANASGQPTREADTILASVGQARRARSRGFIRYRLIEGVWSAVGSDSPEQPDDGFTVAASEDSDEVETLCRTYEQSPEEARVLIRLVAELSARSVRHE